MVSKMRLVLGLALVLIGAIVLAGCGQQTATEPGAQALEPQEQAETPTAPAADPDVPVSIVAYYPLNEGHQYIADYLKEFETKYPGDVSVTVHDVQSDEGRRAWSQTGLTCAGVFVNGKTKHEIEKDGKTEEVEFLKKMDVFWTRADFEAVVNKLLEEAKKPAA